MNIQRLVRKPKVGLSNILVRTSSIKLLRTVKRTQDPYLNSGVALLKVLEKRQRIQQVHRIDLVLSRCYGN